MARCDRNNYPSAIHAYISWSTQYEQDKVTPFSAFKVDHFTLEHVTTTNPDSSRPLRNAEGNHVCERQLKPENVPRFHDPTRGQKAWLQCRPSTSLSTYTFSHIPLARFVSFSVPYLSHSSDSTYTDDREFRVWLQFYSQVELFSGRTRCSRSSFIVTVDPYGDHLLYCEKCSHRILRRDARVELLLPNLVMAAKYPVKEPRLGMHNERPDRRTLGPHGGKSLADVTISHPLTGAGVGDGNSQANPLGMLNAARPPKLTTYRAYLAAAGPGLQLYPVPISIVGRWYPEAHRGILSLVTLITARMCTVFARARAFSFNGMLHFW